MDAVGIGHTKTTDDDDDGLSEGTADAERAEVGMAGGAAFRHTDSTPPFDASRLRIEGSMAPLHCVLIAWKLLPRLVMQAVEHEKSMSTELQSGMLALKAASHPAGKSGGGIKTPRSATLMATAAPKVPARTPSVHIRCVFMIKLMAWSTGPGAVTLWLA